jgi:hypothetical protein
MDESAGALVVGRANCFRFPFPFDPIEDGKRKRSRLGLERWEFHPHSRAGARRVPGK